MPTSLAEVLIERGHANAAALILAGRVLVDGERENRAGIPVREDARIEILPGREYASRGAYKLLGAFDDFAHADPAQRICLDLGASHGGFTQVLLERGARVVYAIDVAYGILDYELRRDERVVPLEKRNARELAPDWLRAEDLRTAHENARGLFVTGDLSFISVRRILDALLVFRSAAGVALEALLLVKPQFEQPDATEKGVMVDAALRDAIVTDVIEYARGLGITIYGVRPARIPGAKGNQEYFLYCRF